MNQLEFIKMRIDEEHIRRRCKRLTNDLMDIEKIDPSMAKLIRAMLTLDSRKEFDARLRELGYRIESLEHIHSKGGGYCDLRQKGKENHLSEISDAWAEIQENCHSAQGMSMAAIIISGLALLLGIIFTYL